MPRIFPTDDSVPAEWQVGDVILDLYEVKQVIIGGGMGLVYRVHHRSWNVDLAVKSPKPKFFQTETRRQNFAHEAETWVNLGLHPHIVSCFYVRTLGGIPRVFAEYIEGGSLADLIHDGRLYQGGQEAALERMLDIAIQMAWGLEYAHEFEYEQDGERHKGLVHQDVKPANILLTPDGRAMVTDFGLAQARLAVDEATLEARPGHTIIVPGAGAMTRAYASPEQVSKGPLTRRTDIWSWGVSVLEMFRGERTWEYGEAALHSLADYLNKGAMDETIPPMPMALVELLQHCFHKDPTNRPTTTAVVANILQAIYAQVIGQPYQREQPQAVKLAAASLNNKALSMYDLGKTAEAEAIWKQALQADAIHPESTYNLGVALWRSGQQMDTELVKSLQEVIISNPGDWLPLWLLSQVHLERGDCESALETLGQSMWSRC